MAPDQIEELVNIDANREQCSFFSGHPRHVLDRWVRDGLLGSVRRYDVLAEIEDEIARRDLIADETLERLAA